MSFSFSTQPPGRGRVSMVQGPPPLPRKLHVTLEGHVGSVHVARYAKGAAKHVLTGGNDRTVRLWNPATGALIKTYKGHGYEVLSIAVLVYISVCLYGARDSWPRH